MKSYTSALRSLATVADGTPRRLRAERKPLAECVGHFVAEEVRSSVSTPAHDTSAMDGYAVSSAATSSVSPQSPLLLEVHGTIAAGDDPKDLADFDLDSDSSRTLTPCIEIMTGGIFPTGKAVGGRLDACVKVEDTAPASTRHSHRIVITAPVSPEANRRLAGADVERGMTLLAPGTRITPQHLLVLASAQVSEVLVWSRPRVGVWSTGEEVDCPFLGGIPDANGPFITSAVRAMGAEATFLGILRDNEADLAERLRETVRTGMFDLFVTTGGVSMGRFDFLASSLQSLGATIVFHGLDIRPGHPVLLGTLPSTGAVVHSPRDVPIFGLPGNPGAAAACFRFLVCPFLDLLRGLAPERPILAVPSKIPIGPVSHGSPNRVLFRHGVLRQAPNGHLIVDISPEQSPAKLSPHLRANCWVRVDPGPLDAVSAGLVPCYLMPGASIDL